LLKLNQEEKKEMAETIRPLGVQSIIIRKIILWRGEVDSRPGALAEVLDPFVNIGTDLQVVMRYRHPREDSKAIVDVCP
jgi:hypothetical protein